MHIELANNNGTKYLKLARCHRGTNSKGKKTILPSLPLENLKIAFPSKPACVFRLRAS